LISVAVYRRAYATPTRDVAWSLEMLARNFIRQGSTAEARSLLREAIEIRTATAGADDPLTRGAIEQLEALGSEPRAGHLSLPEADR
jgi:hypothetical protein